MAKGIRNWPLKKMAEMIVRILLNRFDCFIVIEGNRGLGKSTLAIKLSKEVSRIFRRHGIKDKYKFRWRGSLIYTRKKTKQFFHKWRAIGIADEMINVTFNRDFFDKDQKDIIKMINMNRDHCNLFIACVPQFQTLDSQIKNLCKIRITVIRRGLSIIQTPNQTVYSRDKWDQATNEKIEKKWLMSNVKNPAYTRLTTFRGFMRFTKLSDKDEKRYQEVKDAERNIIAEEEMEIEHKVKELDPLMKTIERLEKNEIKNMAVLDGIALGLGKKPASFVGQIRRKLREQGKNSNLTEYFWEDKMLARKNPTSAL